MRNVMNTVLLNVVSLDDGRVIKKGGSAGGGEVTINNQTKNISIDKNGDVSVTPDAGYTGLGKVNVNVDVKPNNQDKVVDIVENGTTEVTPDAGFTGLGKVNVNVAIPTEEKTIEIVENGTTEVMAENGYLSKVVVNVEVPSSGGGGGDTPSRPTWTGHADAEGLRSIGWTDEDIAYYQEHGVNWNAEDDEYHKVSDDNKALYGVLTADNISTYKDRIVYLPKIDTSAKTSMYNMFYNCYSLVSIPQLDTSNVTSMYQMFKSCYSLVSIPQLDTSNVADMYSMFYNCYSLVSIPQLDTSNVTSMYQMFKSCFSLVSIPQLDTANVADMGSMFNDCNSLVSIPQLDTSNVTSMSNMFNSCYSLTTANLQNVKLAYQLNNATKLSKESLLYIINNEAATSAITIKLASYAYTRLANDADVVAALANHPNISISQ